MLRVSPQALSRPGRRASPSSWGRRHSTHPGLTAPHDRCCWKSRRRCVGAQQSNHSCRLLVDAGQAALVGIGGWHGSVRVLTEPVHAKGFAKYQTFPQCI
jgi:hypothetical protein